MKIILRLNLADPSIALVIPQLQKFIDELAEHEIEFINRISIQNCSTKHQMLCTSNQKAAAMRYV